MNRFVTVGGRPFDRRTAPRLLHGRDRPRGALVADGYRAAADKQFADAAELYEKAMQKLPKGDLQLARRLRLEWNKIRMEASQLPDARQDLDALVHELAGDDEADPQLLADSREALASAQYYMTWLMRLEGLPREKWEPEVEAARQNYRLLAEQAKDAGDSKLQARHETDLESAVKLARLELEELQGLPLPSQ